MMWDRIRKDEKGIFSGGRVDDRDVTEKMNLASLISVSLLLHQGPVGFPFLGHSEVHVQRHLIGAIRLTQALPSRVSFSLLHTAYS